MPIRLTKTHAEWIDGVDLRPYELGDVLDLAPSEARLLLAEGWAVDTGGGVRRHNMSAGSHSQPEPLALASHRNGKRSPAFEH
jgi:hypothetical protein